MYVYQDLKKIREQENEGKIIEFVYSFLTQHQISNLYKTAKIANEYNKKKNVTIKEYQKLLYKVTGEAVPDNYSADFKMASSFFHRFILQENQFLLGNGITWQNEDTDERLSTKRYKFNNKMQEIGKKALVGGVAFGFWNLDHLEVFDVLEFAPLYDEEDGSIKAGVRFWQVAKDRPLRATLYELDGYTDYIWRKGKGEVLNEKRTYKQIQKTSEVDGTEIYNGENYPTFPIVPLWANEERQSELVGLREQIDCYDLIKSGFANTVDESSLIYWTIQNAGGMDDTDLAEFVDRIRTVHAYALEDDGAKAESHQIEAPYQSREALLERLRADMYEDAMALDIKNIANGSITATQIKASYEPLNSKTDGFEYCVTEFINDILELAGIDDTPTYTRSILVNKEEEVQLTLQASEYLEDDYVTRRILNIFGDGELAEEMLQKIDKTQMEAFGNEVKEE